jgi:hypothetical protein
VRGRRLGGVDSGYERPRSAPERPLYERPHRWLERFLDHLPEFPQLLFGADIEERPLTGGQRILEHDYDGVGVGEQGPDLRRPAAERLLIELDGLV